jgi:5-formyltetrahydrofolate cyclo-ligase
MSEAPGTVAEAKAALRADLRGRRARRSEADLEAVAVALAAHAPALEAGCVAGFVGVRGEPPTLALLDALLEHGVRVLLPRLREDYDLDWVAYEGAASLRPMRLGLREPEGPGLGLDAIGDADLVLAPALAVDHTGRRLGQGGGSYDRALPRARAPVIAVVFDDEILDAVPAEPHDRLVDGALTPGDGLARFGS